MKKIHLFLALAALISFSAHAAPLQKKPAAKPQHAPTIHEEMDVISGKVVETMNSGGYSYVCLEQKGKKTWLAVPEMKVTVGKDMSFLPGMAMPDFTSKTLNRTFDSIVFSSGPAAGGTAEVSAAGSSSSGNKAAAGSAEKAVKVEKAAGADAYTISEIHQKKKSLNKKSVLLKGKVVKVSADIMGVNWIHLQDGTGDSHKGSNDLVVTMDELPDMDDIVTVKGTIAKDKDFGGGYKYEVMMEKAVIQK